jgi:ABC-type nitrate/sulfonate/bicarbonate transport system substrate-binding protein
VGGQLDGFMHDALTTTMALNVKAGAVFMHARRGDMGPQGRLYPSEVVSGNRAFIKAHPDTARRFVKALNDASDTYARSSRPAMVAILAEWTRQDPAVLDALYDRIDPRVGLDKASAQAWWDLFGTAMKARKEISETMRFEDVFDLGLRPQ